jgi:hypothetical protein
MSNKLERCVRCGGEIVFGTALVCESYTRNVFDPEQGVKHAIETWCKLAQTRNERVCGTPGWVDEEAAVCGGVHGLRGGEPDRGARGGKWNVSRTACASAPVRYDTFYDTGRPFCSRFMRFLRSAENNGLDH